MRLRNIAIHGPLGHRSRIRGCGRHGESLIELSKGGSVRGKDALEPRGILLYSDSLPS